MARRYLIYSAGKWLAKDEKSWIDSPWHAAKYSGTREARGAASRELPKDADLWIFADVDF